MSDWHLYLIRCRDGGLYTGITVDVARRFDQHKNGTGAKFLRGRKPLTLVFQKKIGSRSLATAVEIKIKKLSKVQKEELIRSKTQFARIVKEVKSRVVKITTP